MSLRRAQKTEDVAGQLHQVKMGVGEAIQRLVHVEFRVRQGLTDLPQQMLAERDMLVEALNQFELDLGFDCNNDGVPDDVSIFEESVATSCCRILPFHFDTSRKSTKPTSRKAAPARPGAPKKKAPAAKKKAPAKKAAPKPKPAPAKPKPAPAKPEPEPKPKPLSPAERLKAAQEAGKAKPPAPTKRRKGLGSLFGRKKK